MQQTANIENAPQQSRNRRIWSMVFKVVVPLVITVGLCYILFAKQDIGQMIDIIRSDCNFSWIVVTLVISIFSHIFRAMRWRIQLRAIDVNVGLFPVVLSIFGTYAVNLVLPRLGELWRTGYIAQRQDAPFDKVFGSMVADRLADAVTVGLLTLFTFIFAGGPLVDFLAKNADQSLAERLRSFFMSPWPYIIIIGVAGLCVWIGCRFRSNRIVAKIRDFIAGLWQGFAAIATMKGRGRWLLLTACVWGCYFMQLYVAFFAFPATAEVVHQNGIGAVLVCFVLSSISMVVPSNGGIGPWQIAIIFGLGIYSANIQALTTAYATSFANLVMGSQTILLILLGLFTFVCIAIGKRKGRREGNAPEIVSTQNHGRDDV